MGGQDDLPMRYYTGDLYVWCFFPFLCGCGVEVQGQVVSRERAFKWFMRRIRR